MKVITYILSLVLSAYTYLLFAAYLSISGSLDSVMPLISVYGSIVTFGVLSWLHFYKPVFGISALTIFTILTFVCWPMFLIGDYFDGEGYKPGLIEWLIPLTLTILVIVIGRLSVRKRDLNRIVKVVLAMPPLALALYFGVYFSLLFFG